jgi:stage II sporulation protein D
LPQDAHYETIKAQIVIEYTNAIRENLDLKKTPTARIDKTLKQKIASAYTEVENEIITHNGQLIVAAYHTLSNGNTNTAQTVWGKDVDYLTSALSEGDLINPNVDYSLAFTKEQMCSLLNTTSTNAELTVTYNNVGYVQNIKIMDKEFSGEEFRALLSLPSSSFSVETVADNFIIKGKGRGHGVGLSINGADFLARQGYTYKDILTHYYKGCEIKKDGI